MSASDLQSKDHRDLLDIIDQLRSQGVSRYVDLPEIIVCGDQSAGKSSVLEAISGMSFPTKDGVCTRFATELVLRRDATTSVKVSIHPGDDRDQDERDALLNWQPETYLGSDGTGLGEVIESAKTAMGLSATKIFCNDILRIELSGPTQPHLTMVDLPGLFRAGNKQQSADNVAMVKNMVTEYMNKPRSIILAVVSAKNEYVLQEVAEMAKQADAEGLRTMGLITKPDTLDSGSDSERSWVKVALNEEVPLSLGWHVLKNRSYEERHFSSEERDAAEEKFFSQGIWAGIESSHCGVKSLRPRLSMVLKTQILQNLPDLIKDVESSTQDCRHKLDRLGDARETPAKQKRYLLRLSQEFFSLMTAAVQGHYTHVFFGNTKKFDAFENRLRAVVQNLLAGFAETMRMEGEARIIVDSDSEEVFREGDRRITRADYIEEVVTPRMRSSRGCELPGLFNPLIPSHLFVLQCRPWQGIVQALTQDVLAAVDETTRQIIEYSAADEVVKEVMGFLGVKLEQLEKGLKEVVKDLLQQHYELHAITYNSRLTDNVQAMRDARNRRIAQKKIRELFGPRHLDDPESKIYVNPAQVVDLIVDKIEPSMDHFGGSTIVDYMQAYYKASKQVALERFIDDIGVLAIERSLISKLPDLFTPSMVDEMEETMLTRLVGESEETTLERTKLGERLKILQTGLQSLKRLHIRKDGAFMVTHQAPQTSQTPNGVTKALPEDLKAAQTSTSDDAPSEPGSLPVVHPEVREFTPTGVETNKDPMWHTELTHKTVLPTNGLRGRRTYFDEL